MTSKNRYILLSILFFAAVPTVLSADTDSLGIVKSDSVFVMQKSPWGAVLRSAVLPGWGQFYNQSYWKIPVVLLVDAWFLYNYRQNDKLFSDNDKLFLATGNENYRRYREFYRDQRDLFAIYLGLTYLLTLVDSYVDAQLFDFSVKEPNFYSTYGLKFRYAF